MQGRDDHGVLRDAVVKTAAGVMDNCGQLGARDSPSLSFFCSFILPLVLLSVAEVLSLLSPCHSFSLCDF